ncbi:MAG: RNA-binding protein [Kiritimatiellae bacterium]|nr:RNA-binding protein [Kiritimatiellia bacterium]
MATRLYVGNLSYDTTEGDLLGLFQKAGEVVSCDLIMDRYTNRSRGFAFVQMASDEEAQKAISELDGTELDGRALRVNEARPREDRGGGGGGGGRGGGGGGGWR